MADYQHIAAMLAILRGDATGTADGTFGGVVERLGTPADLAEVVPALAGPTRGVNGQTIYVSGGRA